MRKNYSKFQHLPHLIMSKNFQITSIESHSLMDFQCYKECNKCVDSYVSEKIILIISIWNMHDLCMYL